VTDGALAGLRVIDAATLAAGPLIATWMGEYGPEVIKVEQPDVEERGPQQEGSASPSTCGSRRAWPVAIAHPAGGRGGDEPAPSTLRQRGLFRREYAGPALREHLGIARPPSHQPQAQ